MLTTILAYVLIAVFSTGERGLRKGQQAQPFEADSFDRQSTRRLGAAYAISIIGLLAAPFLDYWSIGAIVPAWVGWIGLVIALGGMALRAWANRVLGAFYTRTLRVTEDQTVVQNGPYRFIRHPGYLGVILMWVGAGLAAINWIVVILIIVIMSLAYHYRIQTEEAMLVQSLGQPYAEYKAHTWKLIPYIY
ncbi:MAG TPA: isoprenylcysteine carboxylmethyltransferase family protein [Longilinea sp.]|nr:isoprenylcysteine carboxylmethyltransferase family protein [Longilinea sp.]